MAITATLVKELRERTGAGMMECKKALVETDGDIDAAIELMRKAGMAKADKKAGRVAAEGVVVIALSPDAKAGAMLEVNCETDFVAKGDAFQDFARAVAERVLASDPADLDALLAMPLADAEPTSVEDTRRALIAKIGENMSVRRFERLASADGRLGSYVHGSRIGVLVEAVGGDADLVKDVAMQVAASRPICVSPEQVPADLMAKEREIAEAQVMGSGKPANIVEKIVNGRMQKFVDEVTLLGQPFVKDTALTVGALLQQHGARVLRFSRFEVGEGIEKRSDNFAEEVMSQVRGA